jgi:hypothetical protein
MGSNALIVLDNMIALSLGACVVSAGEVLVPKEWRASYRLGHLLRVGRLPWCSAKMLTGIENDG